MARFGRRRPQTGAGADADADADEGWPGEPVDRRPGRAPLGQPVDDLPTNRLRGTEITYGYIAGALLTVAGVLMLAITTGKGAPRHTQPIWPALAVVFGVTTIFTIRFGHRILTAMTAIAGGLVSGQAKTPTALSGVKVVALLAPVLFGFVVFRRQSKADRALRAQRPRQTGTERRGRRGAKAADTPAAPGPGRPAPSGRYTPPKAAKERRTRS